MYYEKDPRGLEIDHINGNPNDNRIVNLRVVNHSENMRNTRTPIKSKSGVKGVFRCKHTNKWIAYIGYKGKGY